MFTLVRLPYDLTDNWILCMYEIDNETETLIRSTELSIKRRGGRTLRFLLHETIAPVVDDKYVAVPAPLPDVAEPKAKYVIRGNNEIDVVNKFIAATRGVKRFHYLFEDSNQSPGE